MNKIKFLRCERKLSGRELGSKVGISTVSVTYYENENRDISTDVLKRLSNYFEVTIDYLLCNSDYCIYAQYKEGNFSFKIKEKYYLELLENNYIYFDNKDHRCIDINSLIGINSSKDIIDIFIEFIRMEKIDTLFDKENPTNEDIVDLDTKTNGIELTKTLVNRIKNALE